MGGGLSWASVMKGKAPVVAGLSWKVGPWAIYVKCGAPPRRL